MKTSFLCIVLYCSTSLYLFSQEKENEDPKNYLAITYALTYVYKGYADAGATHQGIFLPGLGLDYFRQVSERTEIGLIIDFEFSDYIIKQENDLDREHVIIICGLGSFELLTNWNVLLGIGVEHDYNKTFGLLRLGTEYHFRFLPKNWSIPVGTFVDVKPGYDAWALTIGVGKRF